MAAHRNVICHVWGGDTTEFDEATQSWRSIASESSQWLRGLPALHGELVTDWESLSTAAGDFGHLVIQAPRAVLRTKSIDDVQAIVAYANDHGLCVTARGAGHSTFGQGQAPDGIVIDMTVLRGVHEVTADAIVVDAGATWLDVVEHAYGARSVPPVLPNHLDQTVGGVLAVGAVTGAAHRWGLAIDHVRELEVVTGSGKRVVCSRSRDERLFEAVLGGLGQHAIIVRATLALVPWSSAARTYTLVYDRLSDLIVVQRRMAKERRFDRLHGAALTRADEGWAYLLSATTFFERSSPPQDDDLLAGITESAADVVRQDKDFKGWLAGSFGFEHHLKSVGRWDVPHPHLDLLLPEDTVHSFLEHLLSKLNPDELNGLPVGLVAVPKEMTQPSFPMPKADLSFAISVPRTIGEDAATAETMLVANRELFERARDLGGKRQPTGAIPFTQDDWVAHFGEAYPSFAQNKNTFDPNAVLAPGYRIFARS
jgi:cytokinin dehydrogenase